MKNIFISKANAKVCPNDIEVKHHKTTSSSNESLNILGPKTIYPSNIQSITSLIQLEDYINKCKCSSISRMIDFSRYFSYCHLFFMYSLYTFYTLSNFIVYFYLEFVCYIRFSIFIFVILIFWLLRINKDFIHSFTNSLITWQHVRNEF